MISFILYVIILLYFLFILLFFSRNIYNKIPSLNKNYDKYILLKEYNNINNFFNISIYKSSYVSDNFMIIIKPQNYHFFIEKSHNDYRLIYHPPNNHLDGILSQYNCDKNFELVYNLPLWWKTEKILDPIPRVICHKNLQYLKKYIYPLNNIIFSKNYNDLQTPLKGILNIIRSLK